MKQIAIKQSDEKMAEYMVGIEAFDPEMLVFIDETGCNCSILNYCWNYRTVLLNLEL